MSYESLLQSIEHYFVQLKLLYRDYFYRLAQEDNVEELEIEINDLLLKLQKIRNKFESQEINFITIYIEDVFMNLEIYKIMIKEIIFLSYRLPIRNGKKTTFTFLKKV